MIAIAYYLLKVMICSGILYGYYHLALKDKVFHQWNRFYLLGSVLISMLLPLVQVEVNTPVQSESKVITVLQMVSGADEYVREANAKPMAFMNGELLSIVAYVLVSIATLVLFMVALYRIHQMIRRHVTVVIDDFYFLNTSEPGTPFSYFRFLLWNREIPLDTENGQRILEHELVHIREKHSWDKLFMQLTLVAFWINPFFWLIRRELSLVHEFIADRKTVGNGDTKAFARLLLETSFPGYAPMMTNAFFTSSIKRRLAMMTKQQQPGLSYLSRLMMIPLLFILLFVFSVKAKNMFNPESSAYHLDKPVTVVIDAGHGGTDAGVQKGETNEKTLTLSLAKLIKQLNNNPKINIVLARDKDELQPLANKVALAKEMKADIYISLHINGSNDLTKSGIEAYISKKENDSFMPQNRRLATLMLKNLQAVYITDLSIKQRDQGIYVLDKNICPSTIVEMGYITNNNDLQFISNEANQQKLARQVLKSIEEYFNPSIQVLANNKEALSKDTSGKPRIELTKYDPQNSTMNGQATRVSLTASSDTLYFTAPISSQFKKTLPTDVKYTIDGKPSYPAAVERLKPEEIFSISVNKGKTMGDKGSIDIITKAAVPPGTPDPKINPSQPLVISLSGKNTNPNEKPTMVGIKRDSNAPEPLYIVDGEEKTKDGLNEINPDKIAEVKVLKGDDAEKLYGSKGKNGVLIITTKK